VLYLKKDLREGELSKELGVGEGRTTEGEHLIPDLSGKTTEGRGHEAETVFISHRKTRGGKRERGLFEIKHPDCITGRSAGRTLFIGRST